jgi:hypothetical protein
MSMLEGMQPRPAVPAGGIGLSPEGYAEFVAKEYLGDYVRAGGAAVRFVVTGSDEVASRWHRCLARAADAEGYLYIGVDAADTRAHMIDQLYAAVARQVDWRDLARRQVRAAWEAVGLPAPSQDELTVVAVAGHHQVDVPEAARSMRRRLESAVLHDPSLAREFRLAALRLCQSELGTGDVVAAEREAVLAWLRVEPVALRLLRSASLHGRVGRHNARSLLVSLAAWRARVGGTGIVLDLDLSRLATARRPPLEERLGHYYSKAAVLDAYEVLRQLVDATDSLRSAYVAVTLPPELVTDDARGLPAYSALHLRVIDEIRDRRRANPFAALVRLETRVEAVS